MKKLILYLYVIVPLLALNAQTSNAIYQKGYYITHTNDTLSGFIKYNASKEVPASAKYKASLGDKNFRILSYRNAKKIVLETGAILESKVVQTQEGRGVGFIQKVVEQEGLALYEYYNRGGKPRRLYFLQNEEAMVLINYSFKAASSCSINAVFMPSQSTTKGSSSLQFNKKSKQKKNKLDFRFII